ncbi:MAG TPA: hypothetical protein VH083_12175, partial [Myxococcales bacterium]|nr:hypothetical protein [Myxococcales bacterium]
MVIIGCGGGQTSTDQDSGAPAATPVPLSVHIVGSGVVQSAAWSCGGNCQQTLTAPLTLQAVPAAKFSFGGWQGSCSGTGSCEVQLQGSPSVTAVFTAAPRTLTVSVSGSGEGRVTSTPSGIDCPGTCSATFPNGSAVTLVAGGDSTNVFHGWSGACAGSGDCTLQLESDLSAGANFASVPAPPTFDVCTGLTSSLPQAFEASMASALCLPGLADSGGTVGLMAVSGGTRQTSFYDSRTGALLNAATNVEQQGVTADYLPQPAGFLEVLHQPEGDDAPNSVFATLFDHQGVLQASGVTLQGRLASAAAPLGGAVLAGDLDSVDPATGTHQSLHEVCMVSAAASLSWCVQRESVGPVYGAGVDVANRALVITGGAAPGTITGQWFDGQGNSLTSEFILIPSFSAGPNTWFDGRPLIGGGLAVRRMDQQNDAAGEPYRTGQWLLTSDAGASSTHQPPSWLQANTNLAIVRSGSAYVQLPLGAPSGPCKRTVQVLAEDGTLCQSLDLDAATAGNCRN